MRHRHIFIPLLLTLALLCVGCQTEQSIFDPAGPAAEGLSALTWTVLCLFLLTTVVMWSLIAWLGWRKRGSLDSHEPPDVTGGHSWILVGGFAIPFVVLAVAFVMGVTAMNSYPLRSEGAPRPDLRVVGHQWWWEVHYLAADVGDIFVTANEIHIPVGEVVELELASADVIHSFWVPKVHGKVDLVPGMNNYVHLQVDEPGVYRGQCAEFCGTQHANMRILLVAQPREEYDEWLENQRRDAATPQTSQQAEGLELFLNKPCVGCHTIRGTGALATVGPDLTHLASRMGLAANMLTNDRASLEAWITHAQAVKPHAGMPNLPQFDGRELRAIDAYLEHLE